MGVLFYKLTIQMVMSDPNALLLAIITRKCLRSLVCNDPGMFRGTNRTSTLLYTWQSTSFDI